MKYTKEQRLDIAKRVYDGELTVEEAAVKYCRASHSITEKMQFNLTCPGS